MLQTKTVAPCVVLPPPWNNQSAIPFNINNNNNNNNNNHHHNHNHNHNHNNNNNNNNNNNLNSNDSNLNNNKNKNKNRNRNSCMNNDSSTNNNSSNKILGATLVFFVCFFLFNDVPPQVVSCTLSTCVCSLLAAWMLWRVSSCNPPSHLTVSKLDSQIDSKLSVNKNLFIFMKGPPFPLLVGRGYPNRYINISDSWAKDDELAILFKEQIASKAVAKMSSPRLNDVKLPDGHRLERVLQRKASWKSVMFNRWPNMVDFFFRRGQLDVAYSALGRLLQLVNHDDARFALLVRDVHTACSLDHERTHFPAWCGRCVFLVVFCVYNTLQ